MISFELALEIGASIGVHHGGDAHRGDEPNSGKKRYVLQECDDGTLGEADTDDELRELLTSVRTPSGYIL